jgi:hypothetical protein
MLHQLHARSADHSAHIAVDGIALPFRDTLFSRGLSTTMMRYLTRQGQLDSITEMVRTTKPGGRIDIVDFIIIGFRTEQATFNPEYLIKSMQDPLFQEKLSTMNKRLNGVEYENISGTPEYPLYHMRIKI